MNFDALWRELAVTDALPREAIETALAHWDELVDRFLAKLRAKASGARFTEDDDSALFYAVHMLAEKRETRAYSPFCRLLASDGEVGDWLGDAMVETLSGILINLYDGDPELLRNVVESTEANEWARCAALLALGFLTRTQGAMTGDEMRPWLKELAGGIEDTAFDYGATWATTIAALGYADLAPDIARAISKGDLDANAYSIKDFHADLAETNADPDGLVLFTREGAAPFGTTLEAMADWEFGGRDDGHDAWETADQSFDSGIPYVNPNRDVGRNDPCPCGSGKKYKKCCLAA